MRYIPRSYRARKVPPNEGRGPRGRRRHPDASPHGQSPEAPSPVGRQTVSAAHLGGAPFGRHLAGGGPHRLARPSDSREPRRRRSPRSLDRIRGTDGEARDRPCDRTHALHVSGPFLSVNGDVVVSGEALAAMIAHHRKVRAPVIALAEVSNPEAFGVVEVNDGKVTGVEEKPRRPKSNLINAGIYILDEDIFPLIEKTPKSPRGEYEITDTIRSLIETRDVYGFRLPGEWIDVGRPWDLLRANAALLAPLKGANHADVDGGATLAGEVLVAAAARARRGADIEGPTVIGPDSEIGPNCYIRPATTIGPKAKVGNACEVKNSILMAGVHVPHQNYVGHSILGERCNRGAGTKGAYLRLDA